MDEREMFEATLVELSQRDEETFDKPFPDDDINVLWALWQAARRTTPDREAITDREIDAIEFAIGYLEQSAHGLGGLGKLIMEEVEILKSLENRVSKTAPTSDKGGA